MLHLTDNVGRMGVCEDAERLVHPEKYSVNRVLGPKTVM
jgi:hypothetical protein